MLTRGDFAKWLYEAAGLRAGGTGQFSDVSGDLDPVVGALADLGITRGIGGGQFGTGRTITRGEAFTMLARALGLANKNTSIDEAVKALVDAGVVRGYGGDPNQLGLNDAFDPAHLTALSSQVSSFKGGEDPYTALKTTQDQQALLRDPAYAAFLREMDFNEAAIESARQATRDKLQRQLENAKSLYEDQRLMSERSKNRDYESRGFFRSGARLKAINEARSRIDRQQTQYENSIAEQQAQAEADAAAKIAELRRRKAEVELNARERMTLAEGTNG